MKTALRRALLGACLVLSACREQPDTGSQAGPESADAAPDTVYIIIDPAVEEATDSALASTRAGADPAEGAPSPPVGSEEGEPFEPAPRDPSSPAGSASGGEGPDEGSTEGRSVRPRQVTYATYRNRDFGFSIDVPANVLFHREDLGDNHGREYATEDGKAIMLVYAAEDGTAAALRAEYEKELQRPEQNVTYHVLRPSWFVVSGYTYGQVFYQRTKLDDGMLKTFRIRYDDEEKPYFDPITSKMSLSFR